VKNYSARYKEQPGKYGNAGYNAANILMDAIARAGSTDAEKIRSALAATNYEAPNGNYRFTGKGQAYGFSLALVQIQGKQPKVVSSATIDEPK